jgi:hypothetical protein
VFTTAHHWSLSWARWIQSTPFQPISRISILILSSHLRLGLTTGLFPSGFPTKILYSHLSHACYMSRISQSLPVDHPNRTSHEGPLYAFFSLPSAPCSQTPRFTEWRVLGLKWMKLPLDMEGSCGQWTRGGPPAWG